MSGYSWMATSAVLLTFMGFFGRLASSHVPWIQVGASRAIIGAAIAIAVARLGGARLVLRDRRGIWARCIFGSMAMMCTFYALGAPSLSLGDASTLVSLSPVFLAALAPFALGERTGRLVIVALLLALFGVVLILQPPFLFGHVRPGAAGGVVIALGASLFSALAMLSLRRISPGEGAEAIVIHFSVFAAVVLGVLAIPHLVVPSARDSLSIAGAGVTGGFAQIAVTRAYRLEPAARVAPLAYITVVGSSILGALVLKEWPTATTLLGMVFVLGGGLIVTVSRGRGRPRPVAGV